MNNSQKLLKKAKAEMAKRELAKRKLIDFVGYNFPNYEVNWHHKIISEKLEAVERGEIKRIMFFMPPRHGKSELCSIQFPAWYFGRNPNKEIITSSYSSDLAVDFGRKARNLVNSQEYENVFETKLADDSKSAGKWHTDQKGEYTATGVGGAITGRGADIFLIDDPIKNREEADSEVVREKVWGWYRSTARTRLNPNASIILIMTRWHDDDLAGRILNNDKDKGLWEVVEFPAIAEKDEKYRKKEEALWPKRYSLNALNEIKGDIGSYEWSALYQQNPIDEESQEFKKDWFKNRDENEVDKLNTRNFLTIDTAISQKASADFTGICDNSVDRENFWNLKAWRVKISPKELIDLLFNLHAKRSYEKIGIEKGIYFSAIKPFLDDEQRKRNKFLPIVELDHQERAKEVRIRGLIPRYESGSVFHIDCGDLEEEALRFPKGVHDDVLDATAYQLQIAEAQTNEMNQEFNLYKQNYV